MLPVYLLWKSIAQCEEIPSDVRDYLIVHFIAPFERAEREAIRIDEIYDNTVIEIGGTCRSKPSQLVKYKCKIEAILGDKALELDARIGDTRRIRRLIIIFYITGAARDYVHQLSLLEKGLQIDSMVAFRILYDAKLLDQCQGVSDFLDRAVKRFVAIADLRKKNSEQILVVQLLTRYCLDKELDDVMDTFLNHAATQGIHPYKDELFYRTLTDQQCTRLNKLRNRHETRLMINRLFEQALSEINK